MFEFGQSVEKTRIKYCSTEHADKYNTYEINSNFSFCYSYSINSQSGYEDPASGIHSLKGQVPLGLPRI